MIVWGVLTELAIGKLFIASIVPGFIVVALFVGYILWVARFSPHRVGEAVPVFGPLAMALGFNPLAFAIIGVLAIETGLLTPPFGILVFTVKAAITDEEDLTTGEIFRGSIPYWIMLLLAILAIVFFPQLATWLPNLGSEIAK